MTEKQNGAEYIKYLNKVRKLDLIDNTQYDTHHGYITAHKDQLAPLYDIFVEGMTFIDLGCGAGNVLKYADNIGYDVTGVDFDKNLLKHAEHKTIHCSFEDIEDDDYKKYDVIYIYRPLKEEQLKVYIEKIKVCMKVGSYIFAPDFLYQKIS
jgi:2-polyprenyl-3-methyl-5-hydroxy-6-metoxy-1,4-benzoquinol methylase